MNMTATTRPNAIEPVSKDAPWEKPEFLQATFLLGKQTGNNWGIFTHLRSLHIANCLRPVHCTGEWSPYGNQEGLESLFCTALKWFLFGIYLLIDNGLNHIPTFLLGVILGKQWYTCLTVVFLAPRTQRMFKKCLSNFHQNKLSKEEYVNVIFTSILDYQNCHCIVLKKQELWSIHL